MTLAVIASASVKIAVRAKPGERVIWRSANRKSCSRLVILNIGRPPVDEDATWSRAILEPKERNGKVKRIQRVAGVCERDGVRFQGRVSVNGQDLMFAN